MTLGQELVERSEIAIRTWRLPKSIPATTPALRCSAIRTGGRPTVRALRRMHRLGGLDDQTRGLEIAHDGGNRGRCERRPACEIRTETAPASAKTPTTRARASRRDVLSMAAERYTRNYRNAKRLILRCRSYPAKREPRRERAVGLGDHECECAKDLRSLAEDARDELGAAAGLRQRGAGDRLTYAVEQAVAGSGEVAADDHQFRVEHVQQHRDDLPERLSGVV